MGRLYTLVIDKASESGTLTGQVLEVPSQQFKSDDINELMQMAQQVIVTYQKNTAGSNEPFSVRHLFGEGFISRHHKDDPEIHLFGALQAAMTQQSISSFESANTFAKVALNALILLNGGAVIAILTFYGNFLIKTSNALNIGSLSCGVAAYALGLIAALVACATGFWCQNAQTMEIGRENAETSMGFYASLGLTKINDSQKALLNKKARKPIIPSFSLRIIAMLVAIVSIVFFCLGSYHSLLSLYENIKALD